MWKSLGDKWDIQQHDEQKYPRKFKSNIFVIVLLLIVFSANSYSVNDFMLAKMQNEEMLHVIRLMVSYIAAGAVVAIGLLKYILNSKEVDYMLLLMIFIICLPILIL